MSNLIDHAKREFLACGYKPVEECEDDPNKWIQESVLELLEVFGKQGHSGSSAPYCIGYFTRLANFQPLSPLTGEDSEWHDTGGFVYQNNRCGTVFKEKKSGICYNIEGYVFREADKSSCFTSGMSRRRVEFPWKFEEPIYVDMVQVNGSTVYPDWLVEENNELNEALK